MKDHAQGPVPSAPMARRRSTDRKYPLRWVVFWAFFIIAVATDGLEFLLFWCGL